VFYVVSTHYLFCLGEQLIIPIYTIETSSFCWTQSKGDALTLKILIETIMFWFIALLFTQSIQIGNCHQQMPSSSSTFPVTGLNLILTVSDDLDPSSHNLSPQSFVFDWQKTYVQIDVDGLTHQAKVFGFLFSLEMASGLIFFPIRPYLTTAKLSVGQRRDRLFAFKNCWQV